jgi:predicted nucleic acid-binding protein
VNELVVDAGIFISLYSPDKFSAGCIQLIANAQKQRLLLCAPSLIFYEFAAVLRLHTFKKQISHAQAKQALESFKRVELRIFEHDFLIMRGLELADQFNQPRAYDTQYLALAETLDCLLWTTDERFYTAVKGSYPKIHAITA